MKHKFQCDEKGCDFVAKAPQGLGAHRRFAHGKLGAVGQKEVRSPKGGGSVGPITAAVKHLEEQRDEISATIEKLQKIQSW